jgi:pimeloyl-ACP methyl ester carboxylesterase
MALIHHIAVGYGQPPIVFVHGFACAHTDWDTQVAHLAPYHQTIAVDLRGHGASPGSPDECSIERYGADVAEVMHHLNLAAAVLVGHSMGCRVVIEAALQAPHRVAGLVLVDGSQFAAAMRTALVQTFDTSDGYRTLIARWFREMFTTKSNAEVVAKTFRRAGTLPQPIGKKLLLDLVRYDSVRLATSLASVNLPVMAIQSTYSNEQRERRSVTSGQTTSYLDMLRINVPAVRVEIIPGIGHFPQIDSATQVNELLDDFVGSLGTAAHT